MEREVGAKRWGISQGPSTTTHAPSNDQNVILSKMKSETLLYPRGIHWPESGKLNSLFGARSAKMSRTG